MRQAPVDDRSFAVVVAVRSTDHKPVAGRRRAKSRRRAAGGGLHAGDNCDLAPRKRSRETGRPAAGRRRFIGHRQRRRARTSDARGSKVACRPTDGRTACTAGRLVDRRPSVRRSVRSQLTINASRAELAKSTPFRRRGVRSIVMIGRARHLITTETAFDGISS